MAIADSLYIPSLFYIQFMISLWRIKKGKDDHENFRYS